MIDCERAIKGLECCVADTMACGNGKPFEDCPYLDAKDEILDCCGVLMRDALTLLKADQYYLQKLTERLQTIADYPEIYGPTTTVKELKHLVSIMRDIAIRGLPEVKDD